jgi:hypothetical protein
MNVVLSASVDCLMRQQKHPVVDVPAIDMTTAQEAASALPARSQAASKTKGERSKQATKAKAAKRVRAGSVDRRTFDAVEALVREGSKKVDAFKAVANQTGRSASTVAATYYRAARANAALTPRSGGGKATTGPILQTPSATPSGLQPRLAIRRSKYRSVQRRIRDFATSTGRLTNSCVRWTRSRLRLKLRPERLPTFVGGSIACARC